MKELEPTYHAKLVALSTNKDSYFALLHLGVSEGREQFASLLGIAITKEDEDGTYYVVLDVNAPDNETPIIKLAVHESLVELSEVPWEIFKDVVNGKFLNLLDSKSV